MDSRLVALFKNVDYTKVKNFKNIAVIPIIGFESKTEFISLSSAIKKSLAEITEFDKSGSVPELKFINKSEKMIFIWDGEELIGGKQNRIANTSILVNANSAIDLPVSCVEQGRWSYNDNRFKTNEHSVPLYIRRRKNSSVTENLKRNNKFNSNQHEIWDNIKMYSDNLKVNSKTMAMSDFLEERKDEIEENIESFKNYRNQNGVLIAVNNQLLGIEYISQKQVFKDLYKRILRSYSSDTLEMSEVSFDENKVRESISGFLDNLASSMKSEYTSLSIGKEVRLENSKIEAVTLEYENEIIYFSALLK